MSSTNFLFIILGKFGKDTFLILSESTYKSEQTIRTKGLSKGNLNSRNPQNNRINLQFVLNTFILFYIFIKETY